ncbi:hypothetical protein Tco_0428596 [Tanacetum coccineum]
MLRHDNEEEEESMPAYDTDIEDVIEEEERFVGKGGFGREEDNIEDVVVVAIDLCSSILLQDGRFEHYYRGVHQDRGRESSKCRKVFNWETAKYDKIWYDEDIHNLRSVETEFPSIAFNDKITRFENEFLAIVYNDALTSKFDFSTKPTLSPQHIDEFDLKDETSLSECDEEEQNVLNFNDLFPLNVIYPNNSKLDKRNDDDKVDIEHSSRYLSVKPLPDLINTDIGVGIW